MESETLTEQINSLVSEYAENVNNIKASLNDEVDTTALESEIETLRTQLENAEENLKWANTLIENAVRDMEERNMGTISNDPYFENNNRAREESEKRVNELKNELERKERELSESTNKEINDSDMEKLNSLSEKIKKMIDFQRRNLLSSLRSIENVKAEMIERAESGIDPTDRDIAKMFIKDNNKKIRELNEKIASLDKLMEHIDSLENSLKGKKEIDFEKLEEYYEYFNNYNKAPLGQDDIQISITFNQETEKYVVTCRSGKFELNPGKEFTAEELTEDNINRLLKGFAGAVANNKVVVNANGKIYDGVRVNNAAKSIINAAKDMDKTIGGIVEEDKPTFNPTTEETIEPSVSQTPNAETKGTASNGNSNGILTEEEIDNILAGMGIPTKDQPKPNQPEVDEPKPDQPEADEPKPDQPEADEPKPDQPEADEPKPDQPEADQPKPDQPEADEPKPDQPEADQPKPDQPEADEPKPDQPEADQPKPDQPEVDEPKPDQPEADEPKPDQPEVDQPKPVQLTPDPVVQKVIKTRNLIKRGVSIVGATAAVVTTIGLAGASLLGIPAAAIITYGVTNALVDGAAAYKSGKVRKSLSKIADKYGLIVNVDRETKSVYFCSTKDLSTRITSQDLYNPNPKVRRVAEGLQSDLDKIFENDKRNIATPVQMEAYKQKIGFITQEPPLEYCQKVTLDNVEAAYQQVGGVYSIHDRKRIFNGKIPTFQQDAEKIAIDFSKSMQPEKPSEVVDVTFEELENLEKEEQQDKEKGKTETKENTEEKSQEKSATQQSAESQSEQQKAENVEETKEAEAAEETKEAETVEEAKEAEIVENPQEEKTQQTPVPGVDVDEIDNAEELLKFMDGVTVGDLAQENSNIIHRENAHEQSTENLGEQEMGEERGRTL